MNNECKFAIFGDCVSHGILANREHTRACGMMNWVSLNSGPVEDNQLLDMANELEITKYEKRGLIQDFSKDVIEWLTEEKADYILIDPNNCRLQLAKSLDGKNVYTMTYAGTKLYNKYKSPQYKMIPAQNIPIEEYKKAATMIAEKILKVYKPTEIILHIHKFVDDYIDGNRIMTFDNEKYVGSNCNARTLMDEMYDILMDKFDGCHIIEFPHYVIGDSNHKFGAFGLYYHSLYDEYGENAIDIICQNHSNKEEKILLDELRERYSYKFLVLRHEIEKKHRAIEEKGQSIIPTLADIQYRLMNAYKYHGYLNEYLDIKGINDFDFIGETEGFMYGLQLFYDLKCLPKRAIYYGNINAKDFNRAKKLGVEILDINSARKVDNRYIIALTFWNYNLYRKLQNLGYKILSYSELVNFTLYKATVMNYIFPKCQELNCKSLILKFPQANRIKNQSALERYLGNNSIYSFKKEILTYGMLEQDIKLVCKVPRNFDAGYCKFSEYTSDDYNVINGYRITTDSLEDAKHNIWVFGSSVALGAYADDSHTIESGLQRKLNGYFSESNEYNVINASNYTGNDVYELPAFFDRQPIKPGDICVFIIEAPDLLMKEYDEIVDLSPYFARPHDYGEIFVDINHMTGKGYCAVAHKIFEIMCNKNMFEDEAVNTSSGRTDITNKIPRGGYTDGLLDEDREELRMYINQLQRYRRNVGAIVMNCNPFTLGHLYLIEYAAKEVDKLFIFVVEEDASFFSFDDRIMLVKEGTKHLKNVTVLPSGSFMISKKTFAAYSNKAKLQNEKIDASLDVNIFANYIAPSLGITVRFAGEEPLDNVTRQYNETMRRILPEHGIEFRIIKRKIQSGEPISASRVRKLLEKGEFDKIKEIVPATTYQYLIKNY